MTLSPKQLDVQAKIKIDYWLDVESERCKEIDNNYAFTKKMIKMLYDQSPQYLFTDNLGRFWGCGEDGVYYPFHMEYNGQLVGYRLSKKAAN